MNAINDLASVWSLDSDERCVIDRINYKVRLDVSRRMYSDAYVLAVYTIRKRMEVIEMVLEDALNEKITNLEY